MSQFVNYTLTLGQQVAPKFGYATLGLSLERYGIDQVIANVPGAVDPTAAESAAYSCGDLTPTEVQAGQTTPTCGVTNGTAPPRHPVQLRSPPPTATRAPRAPRPRQLRRPLRRRAASTGGTSGRAARAVRAVSIPAWRSPAFQPWPVPEVIHWGSSSSVSCCWPRGGSAVVGCRGTVALGSRHDGSAEGPPLRRVARRGLDFVHGSGDRSPRVRPAPTRQTPRRW